MDRKFAKFYTPTNPIPDAMFSITQNCPLLTWYGYGPNVYTMGYILWNDKGFAEPKENIQVLEIYDRAFGYMDISSYSSLMKALW